MYLKITKSLSFDILRASLYLSSETSNELSQYVLDGLRFNVIFPNWIIYVMSYSWIYSETTFKISYLFFKVSVLLEEVRSVLNG